MFFDYKFIKQGSFERDREEREGAYHFFNQIGIHYYHLTFIQYQNIMITLSVYHIVLKRNCFAQCRCDIDVCGVLFIVC